MPNRDFVEERQAKILEYVNVHKRADVSELTSLLSITPAMVRRDLAALEEQGLVYRAHGGVLRREKPSVWQTSMLQDRLVVHQEEKARIGSLVTQFVHDGESIMIDGGSTTMIAARELCQRKNLLVITNSPSIAELLVDSNNNKVIMTGGELMKETYSLVGVAAEQSLSQYRTDKAIIGVSGMIAEEGCFSAIPQEAEIKRIMAKNSRETIVVADSSKLETRALCLFCGFDKVDKLITDNGITKSALETIRQQNVEVFTV